MSQQADRSTSLTTAHLTWQDRWKTPEGRANWLTPEEDVAVLVPRLHHLGARRVLDLGSGVGRHAIFLASEGFEVHGLEATEAGIEHAQGWADEKGVEVTFQRGQMTELPYDDGFFDYVLSWNVIYHGDATVLRSTMREVARVLKPKALFQFTLLSKHYDLYGKGREVAFDTFVFDDDEEKRHPHFYCDAAGAVGLSGEFFDLLSLETKDNRWHWRIVAEKRLYPRDGVNM